MCVHLRDSNLESSWHFDNTEPTARYEGWMYYSFPHLQHTNPTKVKTLGKFINSS